MRRLALHRVLEPQFVHRIGERVDEADRDCLYLLGQYRVDSALGVGDPFRCWDAAVELLRQDRESEQRDLERLCERALVLILTQIAWERRGSPGYAPNRDDLAEAALQAASQPLRFQPI